CPCRHIAYKSWGQQGPEAHPPTPVTPPPWFARYASHSGPRHGQAIFSHPSWPGEMGSRPPPKRESGHRPPQRRRVPDAPKTAARVDRISDNRHRKTVSAIPSLLPPFHIPNSRFSLVSRPVPPRVCNSSIDSSLSRVSSLPRVVGWHSAAGHASACRAGLARSRRDRGSRASAWGLLREGIEQGFAFLRVHRHGPFQVGAGRGDVLWLDLATVEAAR